MRGMAVWALLLTACFQAAACGGGGSTTVTVTATVTAPASGAASTGQTAVNLVVTPRVRAGLRIAETAGATPADARKTKGPLKGSIYYGQYGTLRYAVAAFDVPVVGPTDQPTIFVKLPDDRSWISLGDTGGRPSDSTLIPCPLRQKWGLGCTAP